MIMGFDVVVEEKGLVNALVKCDSHLIAIIRRKKRLMKPVPDLY